MEGFISGYTTITTTALTAAQRLGLLTLPLGIGLTALIGMIGGERAIRAAAFTIAAMVLMVLVLNSALSLATFFGGVNGGARPG